MKLLDISLISISLIVAYGIGFYFYEPSLSEETKQFLGKARVPSIAQHVERYNTLEQELDALKGDYGYSLYQACQGYYTAACYKAVHADGPVEANDARRQKLQELMSLLPIVPGDFNDIPSYQSLISGFNDSLYEDMRNGFTDTET
jgi:hypothetical protein